MFNFTHIEKLEAELMQILREVAASFENPCMSYSIGKEFTDVDSHLTFAASGSERQ